MANNPFFYVIIVACLIVGGVLAWGLSTFQAGGDGKKSNNIIQLRIAAHFVAVIVIVGFAYFRSQGGN